MRSLGKPSRVSYVFVIIFLVYVLGFLSHFSLLQKAVYGDGIFYFSWLRSAVVDHDVGFRNEYAFFDVAQPLTPRGVPGNKYSVGPALLWLPNYLTAYQVLGDHGIEPVYQMVAGLTSVFYALIGLLLLYILAKKFFGETPALLTVLTLAGATNLLFYGSIDPVNSHSLSFFAVSVFLALLFTKPISWIAMGVTLGFIGLIRPQDMLVGLAVLPFLYKEKRPRQACAFFCFSAFVTFIPQLLAWQTLYGSLVSPYLTQGEGFALLKPHLFKTFFSLDNGLLVYTPAMVYGGIGFFSGWKKLEFFKRYVLVIILLQLYLISCWSTWWQGASYGIRMFVGSLPLLVFPFCAFYSSFSRQLLGKTFLFYWLIGGLTFLNIMMIAFTLLRS